MDRADDGAPSTGPWQGPERFDDFTVVRPLGHGGMGQVFLGRDVVLDRLVALKVTASSQPNEAARARFLREARAIARLAHPNVVGVYRVGEVSGRPYIAYEFVAGQSLEQLRSPLPWQRVLRIALGVARGLSAAHAAGVLHRDIKPSNVMLSEAGEVKLLDFGLARLTDDPLEDTANGGAKSSATFGTPEAAVALARTLAASAAAPAGAHRESGPQPLGLTRPGALMGTPAYMPPEAWLRRPVTARSDLYAFGLVLFELLTGALPHGELEGEELIRAVVVADAPPVSWRCPDVPPSFGDLVDRCLKRDPDARPASADELRAALEDLHAVFIPSSVAERPLTEDPDAELVARSFARVLPLADAFTQRVYDRLFARRPDLRRLFPTELRAQRNKLHHALRLAVEGLRDHQRLTPMLRDLGRRHEPYGLTLPDYELLGDVLVASLRDTDFASVDDETARAWQRAYAFIVHAMRGSSPSATGTRVSGEAAAPDLAHAATVRMAPEQAMPAPIIAPPPSSARPPAASQPAPARATPAPDEMPRTRYAHNGDVALAYQVFGDGPVDLLFYFGWVSHVEMAWRHPAVVSLFRALGRIARVVLMDKRGTGLSDRGAEVPYFEHRVEDLRVVLDAAGVERAVLVGHSQGAGHVALFAAQHPERTRGLVMINAGPRMARGGDFEAAHTPAELEEAFEKIRRHWGEPIMVELEAPSRADDPEFRAFYADYMRMSGSPGDAVALIRRNASFDARPILPAVRVPTLVLHSVGNRLVPVAAGRYMAARVPGARFVALQGADHAPFTGDVDTLIAEVERFARALPEAQQPARAWATVLAVRAEPGDAGAGALEEAAAHAARAGGRALGVDAAGARVFAFEGAVRALECALRMLRRAAGVRAGLHAGECTRGGEAADDDVTVRAALALADRAPRGGACASEVVRMLASGARVEFVDAGAVDVAGEAVASYEVERA